MCLYLCLPEEGVLRAFPTEAACRTRLAAIRWPNDISCPVCGGGVWQLKSRPVYECGSCGSQPSITAGTALANTRIPLKTWFRTAELVIEEHAVRHRDPYVAGLQRALQSEGIPLSRKAVGRMLKILLVDLAPHTTGLLKSSLSVVPEPPIPHIQPDQQLYWLMDAVHQRWRNLS
ncbi:transposase [Sulfitobacter sp. 1A16787]|uniref:transposase n=1 Tax=Sulfitobacter sp. 1A16787 TaxID=3368571 RepID=UPI003745E6F4